MNEEGARWATWDELQAAGWLDPSGWPLGLTDGGAVYMPRDVQRASGLVIAPPDAGKSRGVLIPAIRSEARPTSVGLRSLIILDPAAELYRLTAPLLSQTHRVLCWNPAEPRMSNTYFDPLAYLGTPYDTAFPTRCGEIAASWYTAMAGDQAGRMRGESYWDNQPIAALTGLIIARAVDVPGVTMSGLVDFIGSATAEDLRVYVARSPHKSARLQAMVLADLAKNERAESGVFGELRRRLLIAANPTVARTIGRPSIDVAALVAQPTALYLQVGTGERTLQPLLSVALSTLLRQLVRLTSAKRALARDVRIVVDELQNIGELYDLAGAINTVRGYGVGFLLATQTRAGLYAVYGEGRGDAIIGACNTVMGLGGLSPDDAEWFSRQLGMREWEEMKKDRTWQLRTLPVPALWADMMGHGSPIKMRIVQIPYPHPHDQKRYHQRRVPLRAAYELRAMDRRMVVVPARLPPFEVALQLYTGT